jgi:hypothetical protein
MSKLQKLLCLSAAIAVPLAFLAIETAGSFHP